jgi:hypothetical protein
MLQFKQRIVGREQPIIYANSSHLCVKPSKRERERERLKNKNIPDQSYIFIPNPKNTKRKVSIPSHPPGI